MLTEKQIKQSALPVQVLLSSLRYVVAFEETANDDFVIPDDDKIKQWIKSLEIARDAVLNLDKAKYQKLLRSTDRLAFDITKEFFADREVIYLIYTNYIVINRLIVAGKWKVPEETEKYFYEAWDQIADYLEKNQNAMISGSTKSATKKADKIIIWLDDKRGFYQ